MNCYCVMRNTAGGHRHPTKVFLNKDDARQYVKDQKSGDLSIETTEILWPKKPNVFSQGDFIERRELANVGI